MLRKILISTAAVAALAAPAFAADLPARAAAPAPVYAAPIFTWTGFYVGVNGGYGWGDAKYNFATDGHYNNAVGDSFGHRIDGWFVGGHVGYNYQMANRVVLGLEGSLDWADIKKNNVISPYYPTTDRWSAKTTWLGSITPRVGFALDRALLYIKGGVAFGGVENRVVDAADYVKASNTRVGWTIGAGVDYAVTNNWIIGLEYNYYDLGSFRVNKEGLNLVTNTPAGRFTDHKVKTTINTVGARLTYKFGGPEPVVAKY